MQNAHLMSSYNSACFRQDPDNGLTASQLSMADRGFTNAKNQALTPPPVGPINLEKIRQFGQASQQFSEASARDHRNDYFGASYSGSQVVLKHCDICRRQMSQVIGNEMEGTQSQRSLG